VSPALAADLPLGKWNTIDDKTGKVKSEAQLCDQGEGLRQYRPRVRSKRNSGASADLEAPERIGGPSRTRTLDPLIKSQLLYQLS
jgi:hypothetical protein